MTSCDFTLVCCVVQCGQGSKALKFAKQHGVRGGTIFLGKGTVHTWLLDLLELGDVRKEVVFMIAENAFADEAMAALAQEMSFHKRNHGIAFSFALRNFIGTKNHTYIPIDEKATVKNTMYEAIFTIVDRGLAEDVVEAATGAGARGGTIINGRGSSVHDTDKVFAMAIEPEKEMVMILVEADKAQDAVTAIREKMHIDEPGNGVLFALSVNQALGLY